MSIFLFSLIVCFSIFRDDFVCVLAGIVQLICWSGRVLLSFRFNSLNCVSAFVLLCFFSRCVPTFFNDIDLSKRDKQIKPCGHYVSLEAQSGL